MKCQISQRKVLTNLFILIFSVTSFSFFSGLAGCDNGVSVADTASTTHGNPVSVASRKSPSTSNNPPGGSAPGENPPPDSNHSNPVKNIILIVGSGMGPQQIGEVIQYRRLRKPSDEPLALEKLMQKKLMGMVATNAYLDIVSDTASATTALSCGLKARNNTIGMDANGNPCETIFEKAANSGKGSGLVSNIQLGQAGVAAFLSHNLNSQDDDAITADIINHGGADVILAGGMDHLIPHTTKMSSVKECSGMDSDLDGEGQRKDQTNLIDEATKKGYQFVCKLDQLNGVNSTDQTKLFGVFSNSNFPRAPERKGLNSLPSLADMTTKALEVLEKKPNGFLLVVHGGLTQLAAEENDAGTLLQEGLDFDGALAVALDYAEKNPNTLLIVTGDHDTGGFGFAASKQVGTSMDLPSGGHYQGKYNYAPYTRYDLLMDQQKSFFAMTQEVVDELYSNNPNAIDMNTAASNLVSDVQSNTHFQLTPTQAKEILKRTPGTDNAQTNDFNSFYLNDNIHSDLMGRSLAPQSSTVWAAGAATSTPVLALATGPSAYAERVRGFIDNTEIGNIIGDAIEGK